MANKEMQEVLDRLSSLEELIQSVRTELYRQANPQEEVAIKMKAAQDLATIRDKRRKSDAA